MPPDRDSRIWISRGNSAPRRRSSLTLWSPPCSAMSRRVGIHLACEFPRENSQDRASIPLLQSNLYRTKRRRISFRNETYLSQSDNSTQTTTTRQIFVDVP